jgi:hypothetical protein
MHNRAVAAGAAWLLAAVYYFYQYSLRSAPSVMMPQLSDAFQLSALGVASLVGLFYYGTRHSAWLQAPRWIAWDRRW